MQCARCAPKITLADGAHQNCLRVGPTQLSPPEPEPVGAGHQSLDLLFRERSNNFILSLLSSTSPLLFICARATWTPVTSGHTTLH